MFRSYKNEVENNCTGRDIVEMFEFVFINGFKAKTSSVDILVFNTIDEAYRFSINEYIIVNSLYAIIENAIEAKAKEISIVLSLDEEQRIQIEVSNNGTKIRKNEVPYLFEKCFTRKKKHYGNGLAIARDWLQSNKCSIVYCEDKQCFRIKISKDLKEGNR
jgi:sensor histidine kinase regulating citrate/malate metabolism